MTGGVPFGWHAHPRASLAVVAGFVDQSHLTRAFKSRFGITPARYRAAHRR
jgi:AraC-like DNA-binding protein